MPSNGAKGCVIERRNIWRVALVAILLLTVWGGLAARLITLHLGDNPELRDAVRRIRTLKTEILVGRGRILDRNGQPLALDLPVKNVIADPVVILSNQQVQAVSARLACLLDLPLPQVIDRVNRPGRRYEPVAKRVNEKLADKVMQLKMDGVFLESLTTRNYPHGTLACHVLGFSNREGVGSAGIEQRWDSLLKGRPGLRQSERDGKGREIYTRRFMEVDAQEGADVMLTIDPNVQHFVEKTLDAAMTNFGPESAWAVVEDVRTGEILAMASRPDYDLNEYNRTTPDQRLNRAVGVNYEPGSVFKVATVAAALNEGIIATNDLFDCENGMWHYGGRPLRDFHPYGELDVTGILRHSSNIGAAKIAVMLGDDRMYRYLKAYGLGKQTGIEVPGEEAGLLHSPSHWSKISITRIAMGHEVAVTAMQMLNILCCIGNDGFMMKPYLVKRVTDPNGVVLRENRPTVASRPMTERTAAQMRSMLFEVTRPDGEGTGRLAAIPGYTVAGKTGTAEKLKDGRYVGNANVCSFMGLVPAERPEIGVIVVMDNPQPIRTAGRTAAAVFGQMVAPIVRYLDIRPVDASELVNYHRILSGEF